MKAFKLIKRAMFVLVPLLCIGGVAKAQVTLTANDYTGGSNYGDSFDAALNWSNGAAPSAANSYVVGNGYSISTVYQANETFQGSSLTFQGQAQLVTFAGNGSSTLTINNLILNDGYIGSFAHGGDASTIAGNINIQSGGGLISNSIITADISGVGNLYAMGSSVTLSNSSNSYSGTTQVENGSTLIAGAANVIPHGSSTASTLIMGDNVGTITGLTLLSSGNTQISFPTMLDGSLFTGETVTDVTASQNFGAITNIYGVTSMRVTNSPTTGVHTTDTLTVADSTYNLFNLNGYNQEVDGLEVGAAALSNATHEVILNQGAPAALTINNDASTTNANFTFGGEIINGTGLLSLVKNGSKTMTLSGANTYLGGTTINAGTLLANGPVGTISLSTSTGTTTQYSNVITLTSTAGLAVGQSVSGTGIPSGSVITEINSGSQITINNTLGQGQGGSPTLTFAALHYSSLGAGSVMVNNGGTLGGTGGIYGAVTVNGGGAINLTDGQIGTLSTGALTIGNAGTPSALTFEITSGSSNNLDNIAVTGKLTMSGVNGTTITIANIGSPTLTPGLYNLITYTTTESGNLSDLNLSTTSLDGESLSLVQGTGAIELQIGSVPVAYFNGQTSSDLNTASNYYTTAGGSTPLSSAPGSSTDVVITSNNGTTGASALAPTLNSGNLAINSLTFAGTGTPATAGVTLSGTGTLTIEAATTTGSGGLNTAPNGITVQTGAGNDTISTPVALGASQSWSVTDATSTLTVSSQVSDGGHSYALTKSGAGVLNLSGSNTYGGGTTVSAGTLLANNTSGSATGTGSLTVNAGATIGGQGTISGAGFNITGTGTTAGTQANVLAGLNSAASTATTGTLTVIGSGVSSIGNAQLTFNLDSASRNSTQLNVGGTSINFAAGQQSTTLALNIENASIIPADSSYVLIAGTGTTSGLGGATTGQYAGLTTFLNSQGLYEITGSSNGGTGNLVLSLTGTGASYYGNGSYLYISESGGVDDIDVEVVPEPGTWALMASGLALLVFWQRRRSS